jgi:hypothetical protein
VTVPNIVADDSELNHAERAFLDAVLVCHGVREQPTESDFNRAMKVMIAYAQQVQDNPPEGAPSQIIRRWLSPLSDLDRIKIAAAAFVKFGATKPSIFQVRAVQRELFGPAPDSDSSREPL